VDKHALIEALSKLTVLEMAELKTALEEKWGVKAAAAAAPAAAAPVAAAAEAAPESTEFEVTLLECPADKKIGAIKVVREVTGLGLKEAKDLVEGAPKVVKTGVNKTEAEDIVKKLLAAETKAALKGL
jgi:large subunit ribosomal protein L7/L12